MNQAPITQGAYSGQSPWFFCFLSFLMAAINLHYALAAGEFHSQSYSIIATISFLGLGICQFINRNSPRNSPCRIEWENTQVRILKREKLLFEGEISSMHHIDDDLSGYFIYPTQGMVFRLLRRHTPEDLASILDSHLPTPHRIPPHSP